VLLPEGGGDDNGTNTTNMTMDDHGFQEIATVVADEMASGRGGLHTRREGYTAASTVVFNYCNDVPSAIDMVPPPRCAIRLISSGSVPSFGKACGLL